MKYTEIKQYQEIKIKYMWKTDRIQIKDLRFDNIVYIPVYSGNILSDVENFLNDYNYKIIGYAAHFKTETYTVFIENNLDKNSFRMIDKSEYNIKGY